MSGKLDRAIAETEKESQSKELAFEAYVRERRALDEQIPSTWLKLKSAIKSRCEAKPKHLQFKVCPDTDAKDERRSDPRHRMLELELLRESGIVRFDCGEASGCFTIRLNRQNVAGVCDQDGSPYASIEAAADEVLSLLFS